MLFLLSSNRESLLEEIIFLLLSNIIFSPVSLYPLLVITKVFPTLSNT